MTDEKPATIGEAAVLWADGGTVGSLHLLRGETWWRHKRLIAARIDALVAEHVAAKDARIKEFEDWARAMCKAECDPYRKIGRHAPNCPCADLNIEPEEP